MVNPPEAWCTFIDDEIIQATVICTYQSINESIARSRQQKTVDMLCHLFGTNFREMKASVGFWYIHGLLNWSFQGITTSLFQEYEHKIFHATM